MKNPTKLHSRLLCVLDDIDRQGHVSAEYTPGELPFNEEMAQIREYIETAAEYEIAYEILVATLESRPFVVKGHVPIALLECALLLGYKTTRDEDRAFDRRRGV